MNADDSGPQNQPADDEIDTTPTAAPMEARSPLLDGIACAADVSSTSEEPVIRLSCHELPDRPWYGRFQPRPPCHIGAVETNPTLPTIELPHGSDGCSVYVRYLDSYTTLASNLLWIDELVEWYGLPEDRKPRLLATACGVLQAMDTRLIHCLIRGDLPKRYREDKDVKCIIDRLWRSQDPPFGSVKDTAVQPAVYIQYLTSREGSGLNASQYRIVIRRMREYAIMQDVDYALKVDTFMPSSKSTMRMVKNRRLRYLNSQPDTPPSFERIGWILRFCEALEHRVESDPRIEEHPLREVGYSHNAQRRLAEHKAQYNSNFLMNLIEVICNIEFRDRFHFDQYIVAKLDDVHQAVMAEVILTRLASGYIPSGMGLSFWTAGKSTESAWEFTAAKYQLFQLQTYDEGPFRFNHKWERDLRAAEAEATRQKHQEAKLSRFYAYVGKDYMDQKLQQYDESDSRGQLYRDMITRAMEND
jgi:hypothetical protein